MYGMAGVDVVWNSREDWLLHKIDERVIVLHGEKREGIAKENLGLEELKMSRELMPL